MNIIAEDYIFWIIALISSIHWTIGLLNVILKKKVTKPRIPKNNPLVSVLIPARNEERRIGHLIECLHKQTYKNIEIIICDDESTDKTREIIDSYNYINNLSVIKGTPKPNKWSGKVWACHQISTHANGDIYLFLDADFTLHPRAIEYSLGEKEYRNVEYIGMNSEWIWPHTNTLDLLMTFNYWELMACTPIFLQKSSAGGYELIDAQLYKRFGGHKSIYMEYIDGSALVKRALCVGGTFAFVFNEGYIGCYLFSSSITAIRGIGKFIYIFIGGSLMPIVIILKFVPFILQFILSLFYVQYMILTFITFTVRFLIGYFGMGDRKILFKAMIYFPVQFGLFFGLWVYYFVTGLKGNLVWKNRKM